MKVFVVDISGKVLYYDNALCNALSNDKKHIIYFVAPDISKYCSKCESKVLNLLSLVPQKYKNSDNQFKRIIKAVEGILNYLYLFVLCLKQRPTIIHFQWLPFLEVSIIELIVLKFLRKIKPNSKFVLTIHNLYPHDFDKDKSERYKKRFIKVAGCFDSFVCHTEISRNEVIKHFDIKKDRINVVHHGVFEPNLNGIERNTDASKPYKKRFIIYGNQNPYKGTDLIIDAFTKLSSNYREQAQLAVVGQIQPAFYDELKTKGEGFDIEWMPYFVDNKTLNQQIVNSDVIVLPYRSITQSGVLLLALYFKKLIVCSDLPSFRETLDGYPPDLFFKTGDSTQLMLIIENILDDKIDENKALNVIERLKNNYSWDAAAKKTIDVYNK